RTHPPLPYTTRLRPPQSAEPPPEPVEHHRAQQDQPRAGAPQEHVVQLAGERFARKVEGRGPAVRPRDQGGIAVRLALLCARYHRSEEHTSELQSRID